MKTLTVAHAEMSDNIVTLRGDDDEEYGFVRDVDGRLYHVADWKSKADIIREFE